MKELLEYYRRQGAPGDQMALVNLLKELQQIHGAVPKWAVTEIAESYRIKESFILAVVKRIPSLRLQDSHLLQLCAGPNCGKHTALAAEAERIAAMDNVAVVVGVQRRGEPQTFKTYMENRKEKREAAFNYPLFLGVIYLAVSAILAYTVL